MIAPPAPFAEVLAPRRNGSWSAELLTLCQVVWFVRLRWVLVAAALAALGVEQFAVSAPPPRGAALVVLVVLAATNIGWWIAVSKLRTKLLKPTSDTERYRKTRLLASGQMATDLLLLTALIAALGGVGSPLAVFYLMHVVLAAILLDARAALAQAVWGVLLYGALAALQASRALTPGPLLSAGSPPASESFTFLAISVIACTAGVFGVFYLTRHLTTEIHVRESALRRTCDELRMSQRAVQDLLHRRWRFLLTSSHQMKAPLAAIQMLAWMIRDGVVSGDDARRLCETIARRCEEGRKQAEEMIALARIQQAAIERVHGAKADARVIVQTIVDRYHPIAEAHQVEIGLHAPADAELSAAVESANLADCVSNLVENGVKFTPAGGRVDVTLGCSDGALPASAQGFDLCDADRPGPHVWIEVRDTGIGIDARDVTAGEDATRADSLFDAFRRGNAALAAGIPGTGLGLSIVREVVEQCGGDVFVSSRRGSGTTVLLLLPTFDQSEEACVRDTRRTHVRLEAPPAETCAAAGATTCSTGC